MPRRKGKKSASAKEPSQPKPTYHKSKNGRYYKKSMLASGKSQCRFCSKSEAMDGMGGSSEPPKKKKDHQQKTAGKSNERYVSPSSATNSSTDPNVDSKTAVD